MLDLGECYLRIIFLGSLFVNFAQSSNMIMRGEGELARAMGIMAGGAILNMVLAPVFILALRDQGWAWKEPRAPPCCRRLCWRA